MTRRRDPAPTDASAFRWRLGVRNRADEAVQKLPKAYGGAKILAVRLGVLDDVGELLAHRRGARYRATG